MSVQEAWRLEEEEAAAPVPLFELPHEQGGGTPTAPSGRRQGWQGVLGEPPSTVDAAEQSVDAVESGAEEPAAD